MLDELNYFIGPGDRIVERGVVAVDPQKQAQRCESRALMLECMRASDACHQRHRQHDNVLFTEPEKITRARQCAFEKTRIANEMAFTGLRQLEPIVFDDDHDRQPMRLIRQGRLGSSGTWRCVLD